MTLGAIKVHTISSWTPAIVRVFCLHSPSSAPRVAAQEAAQSRHTTKGNICVALIVASSRFGKCSSVRSDFSTEVQNCCFQLRRIPNQISSGFSQFSGKRKPNQTALYRSKPWERTYGLFLSITATEIKWIFFYFRCRLKLFLVLFMHVTKSALN